MSILIAERDAGDTRENTSKASKSADGDKSRPRSPSLTGVSMMQCYWFAGTMFDALSYFQWIAYENVTT